MLPSLSKPGLLDRTGGATRKILHHRGLRTSVTMGPPHSPRGPVARPGGHWPGEGGGGPTPLGCAVHVDGLYKSSLESLRSSAFGSRRGQRIQEGGRACQATRCLWGHWVCGHPSRGYVGCSGTYRHTPICLADKRGSSQGPQNLTTHVPGSGGRGPASAGAAGPGHRLQAPTPCHRASPLTHTSSYPQPPVQSASDF